MSKKRASATVIIFLLCGVGALVIAFWPLRSGWPFSEKKTQQQHRTRVIIPSAVDGLDEDSAWNEYMAYEDNYILKAPLADDEITLSVLNLDLDNDSIEEQIVAFRSLSNTENPVSIAYIDYDERLRAYRYLWNTPVAATLPGTVSLYTQDLLGDRSFCIIVTGMNEQGEHTMTVFRKDPQEDKSRPFAKIAEIRMGGSITVQETERPLAYQQGIARGQPFVINAWGRDTESDNMLDRVEISYTYNPVRGIYEQSRVNRVAGSQIEERRLREILSGQPRVFEEFINDLWYHVNPDGTIDRNQYLYFDPLRREIIFFGDEAQQVFLWQNSNSTRYGLYISSQNISVTTLRRFLDVELESLDKIRMRVFEDVRLKISVSTSWDGSYRRAGAAMYTQEDENTISPYTDAIYDSSMGRLRFHSNGEYELSSSGTLTKGKYAFFRVGSHELLELRPEHNGAQGGASNGVYGSARSGIGESRLVFTLTGMDNPENLSLSRVRLGAAGVHELHEAPIILIKAQ